MAKKKHTNSSCQKDFASAVERNLDPQPASEKNSQGEKAVSTEGDGDPCASKERQEKLQSRLRLSLNLPEQ